MLAEPAVRPSTPGSALGRRLLLLSYHFPPGQAAGALRWQKLSRIAIERGWQVEVVTLERPEAVGQSPQAGVTVHQVPQRRLIRERTEHFVWQLYDRLRSLRRSGPSAAPSPPPKAAAPSTSPVAQPSAGLINLGAWKRAYYAWLEAARDRTWAVDAAECARKILRQRPHDLLVTCGPPHMIHWAGQRVAAEAGIPFVMDLRDPWSLVERLAEVFDSPVWYRIARRYERQAVAGASLVVMNSDAAREAMTRTYPAMADRIITVMNGYDEDEAIPPVPPASQFRVVFAGSVYLDRNPSALFKAAARVVREFRLSPADFQIEFVGHVGSTNPDDPTSITGLARVEGIADFLKVSGFRPRRELAELLASATVLLSLYQDSRMAIPSKIFEYMQYDAWILTFAETGSATEQVLRGTGADILGPHDFDGLVETLTRRFRQFRNGERPVRLAARDNRFSRRSQAGHLFERLERLVPTP
jgi:glycosyltransferase involved in cell wall biosynthesis